MSPVFQSYSDIPSGPTVVSIGTFDGVHTGHQYLIDQALHRAHGLGVPLQVVTFEPNPSQVLRPESFRGRLNTPAEKIERLLAAGADRVLVLPFTDHLRNETPETFMAELQAATTPLEVWVGEEFALGHDRAGTIDRLTAIGHAQGYRVVPVLRREVDGQVVSSSLIRYSILEGAVDRAYQLLGYPYRISGEVIRGAQIGRTIGFPTANVNPPSLLVPVPDGIYASYASLGSDDATHLAMTYIGTRPALNTGDRQIETHVLDFSRDLYGQILHTDFILRLRPDSDFSSVDDLVAQLKLDEQHARESLAALSIR